MTKEHFETKELNGVIVCKSTKRLTRDQIETLKRKFEKNFSGNKNIIILDNSIDAFEIPFVNIDVSSIASKLRREMIGSTLEQYLIRLMQEFVNELNNQISSRGK